MVELKAHLCAVDRLTGPSHRDSKFFAQARIEREVHRLRRGCRPVLRPCYLCREIAILELSIFLCHRKQGRALDLNISQTFKGFFTGSLIASFSHAWPMICWKNDLKTRCWQKKPTPLPKTKATTTTTTTVRTTKTPTVRMTKKLYLDPLPEHIELALNILERW